MTHKNLKSFKVYQDITVRRVTSVQAATREEAELAVCYKAQDKGDFFSIAGAGWKYFESHDVVEEFKQGSWRVNEELEDERI